MSLSGVQRTAQEKDFEVILTVNKLVTPTYCQLQSHVTQKLGQEPNIWPQ